jgi:hypothetical protein
MAASAKRVSKSRVMDLQPPPGNRRRFFLPHSERGTMDRRSAAPAENDSFRGGPRRIGFARTMALFSLGRTIMRQNNDSVFFGQDDYAAA